LINLKVNNRQFKDLLDNNLNLNLKISKIHELKKDLTSFAENKVKEIFPETEKIDQYFSFSNSKNSFNIKPVVLKEEFIRDFGQEVYNLCRKYQGSYDFFEGNENAITNRCVYSVVYATDFIFTSSEIVFKFDKKKFKKHYYNKYIKRIKRKNVALNTDAIKKFKNRIRRTFEEQSWKHINKLRDKIIDAKRECIPYVYMIKNVPEHNILLEILESSGVKIEELTLKELLSLDSSKNIIENHEDDFFSAKFLNLIELIFYYRSLFVINEGKRKDIQQRIKNLDDDTIVDYFMETINKEF
jgi:uncharacterized protein with HEPN domain